MTEPLVKTSLDDSIYTITLARPEKRNAVSDRLLGALEEAMVAAPVSQVRIDCSRMMVW